MIGLNKNLIRAILIFVGLQLYAITYAQDNTLYLMPEIPQANQLNPAYFKPCRIYVELPVISSFRLNIRNSGFAFHDAVVPGSGNPYVIDYTNLESKLKGINFAQVESDISLLGAGFGVNDWYFTFGIASHTNGLVTYPYDALSLRDISISRAGAGFDPLDLSSLGTEITVWNSLAVSVSREIGDGFKTGLRVKYLQGAANLTSKKNESFVYQYANPLSLETSFLASVYSSFPVNLTTDPSGVVRSLNYNNSFDNIVSDFIFNNNRGIAFDAGFVYDKNDKTEISFSITDLGFINWRTNTNKFNTEGYVVYRDTTLTRFQNNPEEGDLFRALKDTVYNSTIATKGPYLTLTPVKIFGGITHKINSSLKAGAMTRIEFYNRRIMPSFTMSLNYSPYKFLTTALSYTVMNNKFNQVGAGIALGNRIMQFYLTADNIPVKYFNDRNSSLLWPENARMFSLHTGINLLFGCNNNGKSSHGGGGKGYDQRDSQKSGAKSSVKNMPPGKKKRKDNCPAYN